ncbi:MAG: leucine-rich repeat protein [Bacteroidales bacterium]|jgi:hypothetical protein|nr:leucine-rich repeat protein [Bacteroidales bacterium]
MRLIALYLLILHIVLIYYNTSITNVTIGNSVQVIPNYLFDGCSGIIGTLNIPNSVTSIGTNAFSGCSGLIGTLTIPNSVTSIGNYAFSGCSSLTSVTIPNSLTSIGNYAFQNCSSLTSVTWNAVNCTLPTIASYGPFYNKTSITSVTIGGSVQVIPNYLFWGCSGLTSVTIPNSVTSISDYAFYNCSGLTEITSLAVTPPTLGPACFNNVPTTIPVHVPCESEAAYQSASGWSDFTNYTDCIGNSLNDIAATANISLYPNPASETINITCGEKINSIEVVDLLGKVIYQGNKTTIDVSTFAKGNYFVRIYTDNGSITKKVIVE